jgi:hypothetical protein
MVYEEIASNISETIEEYITTVADTSEVDFGWIKQIVLTNIDNLPSADMEY